MSAVKDAIKAMRDVLLLSEKVDRSGKLLSELANEIRNLDKRLVRLETIIEIASRSPSVTSSEQTGPGPMLSL